MKLLIIESPGKQKTIQKILGAEWKVAASFGHIRALEQNVKFITKNFEPSYEFLKEKAEVIKKLKEESKGHDVYLGADKDYEGEQIAYSVCLLLKLKPDTAKRVKFTGLYRHSTYKRWARDAGIQPEAGKVRGRDKKPRNINNYH